MFFVFNIVNNDKEKILFAFTRMKNFFLKWIKFIIKQNVHNETKHELFINFNNFKKKIRVMFKIINEIFMLKK